VASEADLASMLDKHMVDQNPYYKDLITGRVLQELKLFMVRPGGFKAMMESRGKLGGQNKVPRLANDRKIADHLSKYKA